MIKPENFTELNQKFQYSDSKQMLSYFINKYKNKIVFASSMGAEDQVITHILTQIDKNIKIFTLDTGRLFPETYSLISRTNEFYNINIEIFFPDYYHVEKMVNENGINLFYKSVEKRKLCCNIRKIEPLKRAFKDVDVWICGLRREQSITRKNLNAIEWDETNQMIKVNPLINWNEDYLWEFIRNEGIPYNKLHDLGFPSIGCQPCTRAVGKGEDIRSGRWWWENPESKECGLHTSQK